MCELSPKSPRDTENNAARNGAVDMSPAAVERRLRELAQLYRFGQQLEQLRKRSVIRPSKVSPPPTTSQHNHPGQG